MSHSNKIRFERLQVVCRKALQQSIEKSLSLEQLKTCYPTVASNKEGLKALEVARIQIVEFWLESSLREFKLIFNEREMESKLNELDELIQEAFSRWEKYQNDAVEENEEPVFLNQLTPKQIMDANALHTKQTTVQNLVMIHNQLRLDNEDLFKRLLELAKEGSTINHDISSQVEFLTRGVESLRNEDESVLKNLDELIESIH